MRYFLFISLMLCSMFAFSQRRSSYHFTRPLPHGAVNNYREEPSAALKVGILVFLLLFIIGIRTAWLRNRHKGGWLSGDGYHAGGGDYWSSNTPSSSSTSSSSRSYGGGASGTL